MGFLRNMAIALLILLCTEVDFSFGWEVCGSEHAEVFYSLRDSTVAREVTTIVEANFARVARSIGLRQSLKVRILLPPTEEDFALLTGGRFPDWGIGCAMPGEKTIVLRPSSKGRVDLEELVVHELSHVLLGQATGGARLPRWFDEGVAMWQSRQWRWGQDFRMNKAVFLRQIIPLSQIDNMLFFSSSRGQLAYTESFLSVIYLLQRCGMDVLKKVAQQMASGKVFSQALFEACGCSESEFATEWESYVRHRFNLASMVFDSFNLWIIIVLLFVAVHLIKRYRNRKILQKWQIEENYED